MRDALNFFYHKGHEGNEGKPKEKAFVYSLAPPARAGVVSFVLKIFSPENILAFVLFLIVIALIIFTTDSSPVWIYQGF